ncbi:hypothetical protein EP7_005275 [Isosphaeraceae bacterium EP7]
MNRRLTGRLAAGSCAAWAALVCLSMVGCDYSVPEDQRPIVSTRLTREPDRLVGKGGGAGRTVKPADAATSLEERQKQDTILESVLNLIATASIKPGGDNFAIAAELLNEYFARGSSGLDYSMAAPARQFLARTLPEKFVKEALEGKAFTIRDARHLEDCMMYHKIATRVGGVGDDLTRVRRIFDWVITQVMLAPAGSLAPPGLPQAQARPYDVLMRGMATEGDGFWSERAWLFMVLCRQLGVDVGLLSYTPRGMSEAESIPWACGAVIGDKVYLFDQRRGLEVPGPDGKGVATLEDALADSSILEALSLPGQSPNEATRSELLASPTKIGVLIDSSRIGLAPRMKLLQQRLTGKDRTILYRDPAEQQANFARAMGPRLGEVNLWQMPLTVEERLFTDPSFNRSTAEAMRLLDPRLPLLYARHAQLRGDLDKAKLKYVEFRKAVGLTETDGKTPVSPDVQQALDVYATYFLALCHLEMKNTSDAKFFFLDTLKSVPEPGPRRPYYLLFRRGAAANLGRLYEAEGDGRLAAKYYGSPDSTPQGIGNLIRARDLAWADPTGEVPDRLPRGAGPVEVPAGIAAPSAAGGPAQSRPILPTIGQAPAGLGGQSPSASSILQQAPSIAPAGGNP